MASSENHNVFSNMCRLCASQKDTLVNLLPKQGIKEKPSTGNILDIIERYTTIKISPSDGLPQKICQDCVTTLNSMLQFQNKCKRSDAELQKMKRTLGETDDQSHIKIEILDDPDTEPDVEPKVEPEISYNELMKSNEKSDLFFTEPHQIHDTPKRSDLGCINFDPRPREQKIACHICGKLYDKNKMKYHINRHNGLKPYECEKAKCTSKFASPQQLKNHIKVCHIIEPHLFCDVCGRGFKRKIGLVSHRSYHFDPELPCKICDKLFRNSRALKKHMLVHSQERKFPCDLCTKKFQTRYTLRIHKRVHTQEKPYSCICGVSFAYKCLLKAHTEKKQANCLPSSS